MSEIAVLLVEDEDYWSRKVMEAFEGVDLPNDGSIYSVDRAASPDEALALADRARQDGRPYDIAILDLKLTEDSAREVTLPDGYSVRMYDGNWLFEELYEKHGLECMVVSAYIDPESERAGRIQGICGFVKKPVFYLNDTPQDRDKKLQGFTETLRRTFTAGVTRARMFGSISAISGSMNNAQDGDERKFRFGPLTFGPLTIEFETLDPTRWNLYFRGRKIDPPAPQPFRVLALLMESACRDDDDGASMSDFFKLLNYDEPRDDKEFKRRRNSVQRYISSLRTKLKPLCGGKDPIQQLLNSDTRMVVGYRLVWPCPT